MNRDRRRGMATAIAFSSTLAFSAPAEEVAARFALLAGNEDNARVLVLALQAGLAFELASAGIDKCDGAATLQFPAASRRLGPEETVATLVRAQASLGDAGISHPSTEELRSALFGGSVADANGRRVQLAGALQGLPRR